MDRTALSHLEDRLLDFENLIAAFEGLHDPHGASVPGWLWTIRQHFDRMQEATHAYIDARSTL